jgi:hypothetical protein
MRSNDHDNNNLANTAGAIGEDDFKVLVER